MLRIPTIGKRGLVNGLMRGGGTFIPSQLPGMVFWLDATFITGLSDGAAVTTWTDKSPNGHNATQANGTKQPTYRVNILNGKPAVRFAGGQSLTIASMALTTTSAVTLFAVFSAAATGDQMVYEFSDNTPAKTDAFMVYRSNANKLIAMAKGDVGNAIFTSTPVITTTPAVAVAIIDKTLASNEATGWVNNNGAGTYTDNNNANAYGTYASYVGSRNDASSLKLTGDIFEMILYSRALSTADRVRVQNYLSTKWAINFSAGVGDYADTRYANLASRPDGGTYVNTSPGARLIYTTNATSASVETYNDIYDTLPAFCDIGVRINGVDSTPIEPGALGTNNNVIALGDGAKTVEFIHGLQTKPGASILGTYVSKVTFNLPATIARPASTPRIIVYGDSIAVGAEADTPPLEGWCQLVRNDYAGSLIEEAYGWRALYSDGADEAARTAFAAALAAVSPTVLWLAIGTNDYGLSRWTAANFQAAYADMLVKLHAAMPAAAIYAQTPLARTSEGANALGDTLPDYRAAIANACSGKDYVTLIDGTGETFPQLDDLADGTHPTVAGHAIYAAAVKAVLGIA